MPALLLYTLLDRDIPRLALTWFLLPVAYIFWRAIWSPVAPMAASEATQMIELIFLREQEDGQFLEQPTLANIYFWISVVAFPL